MASEEYIRYLPVRVSEAEDYKLVLQGLIAIAESFRAGDWNFMEACKEADQSTTRINEHDAATSGWHYDEAVEGCPKCEYETLICILSNDPDAVRKLRENG